MPQIRQKPVRNSASPQLTRICIAALFLVGAVMIALIVERQITQKVGAQLITQEGGHELTLEVAHTSRQRSQGLMERDSLSVNAGMLFTYDEQQLPDHSFWMYKTHFPIDIAFLDQHGKVMSMKTMMPCTDRKENCLRYAAGVPFWMALELNAGALASMGVSVGDRLKVQP